MRYTPRSKVLNALLTILLVVVAFVWPAAKAFGEERPTVVIGQKYFSDVVYCNTRKDADDIAEKFLAEGEVAARVLLKEKELQTMATQGRTFCSSRVARFVVVALAASHTKNGETMNVIKVLAVAANGKTGGTYYVINASRVLARPLSRT